jgi:LacI family transcriptional regulator
MNDHVAATSGNGALRGGRPGMGGRAMFGGRPTMKDVASRAGVALKTVSRVVNGEPGVTPETARRVLGAIKDLGFRRNESARLLRTGRTATLGFIADNWADPDSAAAYQGVEEIAGQHGYLFYTGSTGDDLDREERLALSMCARRVDGLVIIPTQGSHDYLVAELEAGVAAVFVLRPPSLPNADAVLPDLRGGARTAVAHLLAHGHRRIGIVGGDGEAAGYRAAELAKGYREAMTEAGLEYDEAWLTLPVRELAVPEQAGDRPPVTAVLCAGRTQTEATLHAIAGRGSGRDGPAGRVAVIGFGDLELADLVAPGITVVSYDPVLVGRTAGELLVRRLGGEGGPARVAEVPVQLIARGSAEFSPEG